MALADGLRPLRLTPASGWPIAGDPPIRPFAAAGGELGLRAWGIKNLGPDAWLGVQPSRCEAHQTGRELIRVGAVCHIDPQSKERIQAAGKKTTPAGDQFPELPPHNRVKTLTTP